MDGWDYEGIFFISMNAMRINFELCSWCFSDKVIYPSIGCVWGGGGGCARARACVERDKQTYEFTGANLTWGRVVKCSQSETELWMGILGIGC